MRAGLGAEVGNSLLKVFLEGQGSQKAGFVKHAVEPICAGRHVSQRPRDYLAAALSRLQFASKACFPGILQSSKLR
jgi:hypothetical protein